MFSNEQLRGNSARHGFSLLEVLVGVMILAMAIIPIFGISTTTTRSAQLVGRHMAATQLAQSVMEWLQGKPYNEAVREAGNLAGQVIPVPEDLVFQNILQQADPSANEEVMRQFRRTFSRMEYSVEVTETDEPKHGLVALFHVRLSYRLVEEGSKKHEIKISALKFPEDV